MNTMARQFNVVTTVTAVLSTLNTKMNLRLHKYSLNDSVCRYEDQPLDTV
jgi:hypothetical protein